MSQIHLETHTMLETENLNTKFQPIRMNGTERNRIIYTSKTPCLAMNERARKREVCFWCGLNARAQRFPKQRNWTRTCECGHPTSYSCKSRNYWVSSASNFSTIGHSDPEIRRWGCTCARAEMPHPTHDLWKALT